MALPLDPNQRFRGRKQCAMAHSWLWARDAVKPLQRSRPFKLSRVSRSVIGFEFEPIISIAYGKRRTAFGVG